jgi:hypothetical protein
MMLKKIFAVAGALTVLASAAYAGQSCCAAGTKGAKSATKSCCAAMAKKAGAQKVAMSCCAKGASVQKTKAVKSAKTEVRVCPMTGEAVTGKGAGSQVVGKYNVHFCCAGCKPAFNKLSKAEQQKKIQAALNIQNAKKSA